MRRIKTQALPTRPLPGGGTATAQWPAPTDVRPRARRRRWRLFAAGFALVAVAGVGTAIALSSGDSSSPNEGNQPRQTAPTPVAVPQSDDPATQARELADFLRAQSRTGSARAQQP